MANVQTMFINCSPVFSISTSIGLFHAGLPHQRCLVRITVLKTFLTAFALMMVAGQVYLCVVYAPLTMIVTVWKIYTAWSLDISLLIIFTHLSAMVRIRPAVKVVASQKESSCVKFKTILTIYITVTTVRVVFTMKNVIQYIDNLDWAIVFFQASCRTMSDVLVFLVICQMCAGIEALDVHLQKITKTLKFKIATSCNDEVHRSFGLLNKLYCRQITCAFGYLFCQVIFITYYLWSNLFYIITKPYLLKMQVPNVIANSSSLCLTSIPIVMPLQACHNLTKSVDAFYDELFQIMKKSETLCKDKKLSLYVTLRRKASFSACGFFTLGYPLITSIIAAATTYLVILVQFSIDDE